MPIIYPDFRLDYKVATHPFQEPVHRQVTMEIHIDFAFHAGQFPQSGVCFCVSKRRRLTKLSVC
jgi:hypothetical protein